MNDNTDDIPPPPRSDAPPPPSKVDAADVSAALGNLAAFVDTQGDASRPTESDVGGAVVDRNQASPGLDVNNAKPTPEQIAHHVEMAESRAKHEEAQKAEGQKEIAKEDKTAEKRDAAEKHEKENEKSDGKDQESGTIQKLARGAEKAIIGANKLAGAAGRSSVEHAAAIGSKAVGFATDVVANKYVPDSIARALHKGGDAVQKGLLSAVKTETAQKVFGAVEKVGDHLEKAAGVAEGIKRYQEAREAGMNRLGAGIDAAGGAMADSVGRVVGKTAGAVAGKSFEFVVGAGAHGVGIGVDTGIAAIRGDRQHLDRISDSAASAKLGSLAFAGDVVGDLAATGNWNATVGRVTDAAAAGQLGNLSKAGDWIGDHAWKWTHSAK